MNTCDSRSARSKLEAEFGAVFAFENGFVENDELWTKDHRERDEEHDVRTRKALAKIMTADGACKPLFRIHFPPSNFFFGRLTASLVISVTVHDGVIRSVLRVTGHRPWQMQTGGVIPLLIKARVRKEIEEPQS